MQRVVNFGVPSGLGVGGVPLWSLHTAQALTERGWHANMLVHTSFTPPSSVDIRLWPDVGVIRVPGPFPGYAGRWAIRSYARTYREGLPGVIIPNWSSGVYAACAQLSRRRAHDLRVLAVIHGVNEAQRACAVYYEAVIHRFVAVSEEVAALLREAMPHRGEDIVVRSCPVAVPDELIRGWSLQGPLRLVYAGRITNQEKKVSLLIPLAERLVRGGVPFVLDVYGDGGYMPTLRAEWNAASDAVQEAVRIHGEAAADRLASIWRQADVCVLVSDAEGSPLSVLEAMAQGAIPVVTRVSGIPALVREGETGFCVPIGDLDAMVEAIRVLDGERPRLPVMGRAAYEHVKSGFDQRQYIPWFESQLLEVQALAPRVWPRGRPVYNATLRSVRPKRAWVSLGLDRVRRRVRRVRDWVEEKRIRPPF